ncbi:RNA polymerase sigma factor [Kordiimonas pumila]|uniref:RNA polymerase sigma factor n=1 Tax=Kordiimonas pumila TaxID=2161677 RepID=A0ABV7D6M0_9PROT|nr:sigma-70 family RNA polymerase sigma factor [Kordiimonas pumila]
MSKMHDSIIKTFLSYREVLVRTLLRMSVKPEDIDDILQETIVRAIAAHEKTPLVFPKSYLYTVSRNMVLEEHQRRSREIQGEIDEALQESEAPLADEVMQHKQTLAAFWEAMEGLPKTHQRAILLRRVYGFSHKEIAKKLGVSISSVEKYFAQGIKRCQDVMSGKGYGVEKIISATSGKSEIHLSSRRQDDKGGPHG